VKAGPSPAWILLRVCVAAVYLFMLGPILITAAVSFNASNRSVFPPQGFSLRWWGRCSRCRSPSRWFATGSVGAIS
jgi:ABC-type spermidine/putrescine transport system permease subunit II